MGNPRPGHVKDFPRRICEACGGDWFREATFYEFRREELVRYWPTPDLVGQITMVPKTIGICLCGRPWSPLIGGLHGGPTHAELTRFMSSLEQAQDRHGGKTALQAATERLMPQQAFQVLADRLKALERQQRRRMRSPAGRGRYWEAPRRNPASKGRDALVVELQKRGVLFPKARKAVKAFWDAMQKGLLDDHIVETPLGVFEVVRGPAELDRKRLNQEQTIYQRTFRIVFRPSKHLLVDCNPFEFERKVASIPSPNVNDRNDQYCCEKCGSTYFIVTLRNFLPHRKSLFSN
jgi:hypothetical protein